MCDAHELISREKVSVNDRAMHFQGNRYWISNWLAQLVTHIANKGEQADFAIVAKGYDG